MKLSQPPAASGIYMVSYGSTCADDLAVDCVHSKRYYGRGYGGDFTSDGDATQSEMVDGVTWDEERSYMPARTKGSWSYVGVSIDGIVVSTDADRMSSGSTRATSSVLVPGTNSTAPEYRTRRL